MTLNGHGLLSGKVVLMSGVGPGLGLKAARAIAREGASVICVARTAAYVDDVVAEIRAAGGTATAAPGDIAIEADCQRIADIVAATYGRLDGMVNSAFTAGEIGLFAQADLGNWRKVMDVNLFGTLTLIQKHLPLLESGGGAAVINVNTHSAIRPMRGQGAYGSSKAALELATRLLAIELGSSNIRVNTVYCGPMSGPNLDDAMDNWAKRRETSIEEIRTLVSAQMALNRIPGDDEPADMIVTLLSDYCRVVTGAAIVASGGAFLEGRIS